MIFDDVRNDAYFKALKEIITPESVVLDLGAGLGLFGLLAAKLGAKKVYLVEPSPVINVAKMLVSCNDFEDRVECLRGRIENVELPEQVDLIVSVFTGNFLLLEDLLPSLFYARDKYLKPGGHLIPSAGVSIGAPVCMPGFHKKQIEIWSEPYFDLNMEPGRRFAANSLYCNRWMFGKHIYLAEPQDLMSLDFHRDQDTSCKTRNHFCVTEDGFCHAIAGWFKMKLGEEWLSTAPHDPKVHWSPVLLPCDPPVDLAKGETLELTLNRPPKGAWTWTVVCQTVKQTLSTFVGQNLSAQEPNIAPVLDLTHKPRLTPKNLIIAAILERFDGQKSTSEIVDEVLAIPSCELARSELLKLVSRLGGG